MKKALLFSILNLAFCIYTFQNVQAQISQGGLPKSFSQNTTVVSAPIYSFENPDWNAYLDQEKEFSAEELFSKPNKVGLHINTDISFPESGSITVLEDGSKIWQTTISVPGAPAIGLLFDKFQLPEGVSLFVSNANKKQVSGAFNSSNNSEYGDFAIDAVQGSEITIELNLESIVSIDEVSLHINYLLVFQRAIEHLRQFVDMYDASLNGGSSVCGINAICPQGNGFENSRKATVQTLDMSPGGGACSGTLVTTTNNVPGNCKPYILTATHCQGSGSLSNSAFSQTMVRFNFERPDCEGLLATNGKSMIGVNVKARASYHESWATTDIKGDFMVLELRAVIPDEYGAILSGWNRNNGLVKTVAAPKKFIGFHHPYGDNKKLSYSQSITSEVWPTSEESATGDRWFQWTDEGYVGPGSSGSGLFDSDGRIIGIASVASVSSEVPASCAINSLGNEVMAMDAVWYDKIWSSWEYTEDGTADNRRIKPWLDPTGTGALSVNPVRSNCESLTSSVSKYTGNDFSDAIDIYPNPNKDGIVNFQFNMQYNESLICQMYDITGKLLYTKHLVNVNTGRISLDLSQLNNGMYIVNFVGESGTVTKKLVINK